MVTIHPQFLREVSQDAKHALRLWANRPWHTGLAIAALAIGIGANTGVFSVVNALLIRPLPFHDPGRLAALPSLRRFLPPHDSAKQFHDWRRQSVYLSDVALYEQADVNLGGVRDTLRAHVAQVSWNFFPILGTRPVLGRGFSPEEDTAGHNALVVIGYGLWQQLFAGDRRTLGSTIRVNGFPLTIIGVAPPGFDFPRGAVLWKAAEFAPGNNGWETVARLQPGITWPQARQAFAGEADRLSPNQRKVDKMNPPPAITSLQDELAGPVKNASPILMTGVVLILLIACTNVVNFLMARTADRATEFSIRSALGASRARLTQQLLTACFFRRLPVWPGWSSRFGPPPLRRRFYRLHWQRSLIRFLDGRVLGFTMLASIVTALFFGVLPSRRPHTRGWKPEFQPAILAADSRNICRCAGHADDRSSHCFGFGGACICQSDANRPRL